jgi:glutamine amidotransferase
LNQYFVHSYVATGVDPKAVLLNCRYSHQSFVAGVHHNNLMGFQFHPERSGSSGLYLLSKAILGLLLVEGESAMS